MKALVTGATGFVGAAVAKALSAAGWEVRVLVRTGSDRSNLQQFEADVAEGDLADVAALERALEGCDGLFHVAADYRLGARDPNTLMAPTSGKIGVHDIRADDEHRPIYTGNSQKWKDGFHILEYDEWPRRPGK